MQSFSKRLKDIMESRGVLQADLAKKTEITETTISRYCNGKRIQNIEALVKIAKALDVPTDLLVGLEWNEYNTIGALQKNLREAKERHCWRIKFCMSTITMDLPVSAGQNLWDL